MLIYANRLMLEPEDGPMAVVRQLAKWISQRSQGYIDNDRLAEGIRELRIKDGSTLTSRATASLQSGVVYPYLFSSELKHRDSVVSGRSWTTEVGLRQESSGSPIECTVLLKTDEISARVTAPIQVTRPRIVELILESCKPVSSTPGLSLKSLDEDSAKAFLYQIEREDRAPLVLLSCSRNGSCLVDPGRLRSVLVGLADVVVIPAGADTYAIESQVGRKYSAFGGAVNIIFPMRQGRTDRFCETVLLRPEALEGLIEAGSSVESEVLAAITHRTNLPASWRRISLDKVGQAILQGKMAALLAQANASGDAEAISEYVELLKAADDELRGKEAELVQARADIEGRDEENRDLRANIYGLKQMLGGMQPDDGDEDVLEVLGPLREKVVSAICATPSLYEVVELMAVLYPDRLVFLDTCLASAKESDRGGFRLGQKAFELLNALATGYWQALSAGKGDQQAKAAFGHNAFAANEAETLSKEGKRLRTFAYRGRDIVMEKHLKHGVKDSKAETLRIHFEWLADERKLVVGHCGKHLNF